MCWSLAYELCSTNYNVFDVTVAGCVMRQEVDQTHTTIIVIQLSIYLGTAMKKFSRAANWTISLQELRIRYRFLVKNYRIPSIQILLHSYVQHVQCTFLSWER
jgi:hypothetical protein